MLNAIALSMVLATPTPAPAGDFDLTQWNKDRLSTSRVGMIVLGSWAVANMGSGAIGFAVEQQNERVRFIHLGNLLWNSVNLALALISVISEWNLDPASFDAKKSLLASERLEKVFFINAGLDVAYCLGAAFMWQRGEAIGDQRLVGFGQSFLVQGAFLIVFDAVMGFLNMRLTDRLTEHLSISVAPGAITLKF